MERQKSTGYRRVANSHVRQGYRDMTVTGTAVSIPDYARPFPNPRPSVKPASKAVQNAKVRQRAYAQAKRRQIIRTVCQIAVVFFMCSLMIYRYAMILEGNNKIDKMNQQVSQMEYDIQYLAAKVDSNLELGTLEKYATEELGMMHPDASQVFYVDVNMTDTAVTDEEPERGNLQGAPGALMHAICVLK